MNDMTDEDDHTPNLMWLTMADILKLKDPEHRFSAVMTCTDVDNDSSLAQPPTPGSGIPVYPVLGEPPRRGRRGMAARPWTASDARAGFGNDEEQPCSVRHGRGLFDRLFRPERREMCLSYQRLELLTRVDVGLGL